MWELYLIFSALFLVLFGTMQYSTSVRNAQLDAIETTIGASPILKIRSGAVPANCGTADAGTVLVTMNLPADFLAAASAGAKAINGTWEDTAADNSGTAGHFRIYNNAGSTCHIQGTVTVTGGGGDMTVDTVTVVAGQHIVVTAFTITRGNA